MVTALREVGLGLSGLAVLVVAGCGNSFAPRQPGLDAGVTRDVGTDAHAAQDASAAEDAAGGVADSGAPDTGTVGLDAGSDAGPPLPVSCDRTGPMDCSPRVDMGGRCPDGPSVFGGDVNAAIDAVIAENPSWFDTVAYPASTPWIDPAHVDDYMQAVTDHLLAVGLCASGPGEELAVKRDGDCSESWDIVANPDATTNLVRRHYVGDCFPAFF